MKKVATFGIALVLICMLVGAVHLSSKKNTLSICAVFKNEAPHLKEWIEYHRLIGVDHFYLYNNRSSDDYLKALQPYIQKGIVTLIHWSGVTETHDLKAPFAEALGTRIPAYENAIKYRSVGKTKWLALLDVDEFLVPLGYDKITSLLKKHQNSPAIVIDSNFFEADLDDIPRKKLVLESFKLTGKPQESVYQKGEKVIFKPEMCQGFNWPPYKCRFKGGRVATTLNKKEACVHRYLNRSDGQLKWVRAKPRPKVDHCDLSDEETQELLKLGYELEDQKRPVARFLPQLLKQLEIK